MQRNSEPCKHWWRAVPAFGLVAGVVFGGAALASADGSSEAPAKYVVVRHILYAGPNGEMISEEQETTTVSAQFVVNQHIWDVDSLPVQVRYNASGAPGGFDVAGIIQEAIGTWNGAGSAFSFQWAGGSSGDTGSCGSNIDVDGVNTIRFEDLTGLTLGQTCTIYPFGATTTLIEFDMQLDNDAPWSADLPVPGNKYDLPTTILHELGHAAGLGHSAQTSALMYFQVSAGQNKRTLTQDDIDGIRAAYPATPTATNTPTPTQTPTSTPTSGAAPPSPTNETPVPTIPASNFRVRAPLLARD